MLRSDFTFQLTVHDPDANVVHREAVSDFSCCYEDALFHAVREGQLPNDGKMRPGRMEPLWHEGGVKGFAVTIEGFTKAYPLTVVADKVLEVLAARQLAEDSGQGSAKYTWSVEAASAKTDGPSRRRLGMTLSRTPYPMEEASLESLNIQPGPEDGAAASVFVSAAVTNELREETSRSLDVERADILTGRLVRLPDGRAVVVVLKRIAAAQETTASKTHVAFSPLTFETVRREFENREDGLEILGWHHNHPPPCGSECRLVVPACKTGTLFFSTADRQVQRSSFALPYQVALVSGKEPGKRADDPGFRAYGWRDGVIQEVRFQVF